MNNNNNNDNNTVMINTTSTINHSSLHPLNGEVFAHVSIETCYF